MFGNGTRSSMADYSGYADEWHKNRKNKRSHSKEYIEKPSVYEAIGDIRNNDVLVLGCGSGVECDELLQKGARKVHGIDNAKGLIEIAQKEYPSCTFSCEDIRSFAVQKESYDVCIASLVMHYIPEWQETFSRVWQSLRPGGTFVMSLNHPVKFGAEIVRGAEYSAMLGYEKGKSGVKVYGDYINKRKIKDTWLGGLEVEFYHQSIEDILKEVLRSQFKLVSLSEPKPIERAQKEDAEFYEIHSKIPQFLVITLQK